MTFSSLKTLGLCCVLMMGLAACGNTTRDRTISGAGLGAAAGAAGGALTGNAVEGALIGGAAGAATGAATDEDQIDLGEPFWKR